MPALELPGGAFLLAAATRRCKRDDDMMGCASPAFWGIEVGVRSSLAGRWWLGGRAAALGSQEVISGTTRRGWMSGLEGLLSLDPGATLEPRVGGLVGAVWVIEERDADERDASAMAVQLGLAGGALAGLHIHTLRHLALVLEARALLLAFPSDPPPLGPRSEATAFGFGPWFTVGAGAALRFE